MPHLILNGNGQDLITDEAIESDLRERLDGGSGGGTVTTRRTTTTALPPDDGGRRTTTTQPPPEETPIPEQETPVRFPPVIGSPIETGIAPPPAETTPFEVEQPPPDEMTPEELAVTATESDRLCPTCGTAISPLTSPQRLFITSDVTGGPGAPPPRRLSTGKTVALVASVAGVVGAVIFFMRQ